ncbi:MAG: FIST N-terminal domain-containing protein, partial [Acidimicrobiales bacterium]
MPVAAAISAHPVSSLATGEAIGQVLEALGERPDVAFVFVTPGHAGALEDIGGAVRSILRPTVLLGAVGDRVLGADLSTFGPGVTLLAAHTGPVAPLAWSRRGPEPTVSGFPLMGPVVAVGHTGVALDHPHIGASATVVGGCVRHWPLLIDGRLVTDGAVGVGFGPSAGATALVAAGFRPFGPPLVVTQTHGVAVLTLAGQPAYACLREVARDALPASDLHLVDRELYMGPLTPPDS